MGRKRGTRRARRILPTQRDILRDVMLTVGKYGAWMTLRELARPTRYGETSISAQLRHLRKAKCGGFMLEKRGRKPEVVSSEEHFVVWEYRLTPRLVLRRIATRRRARSRRRRRQ